MNPQAQTPGEAAARPVTEIASDLGHAASELYRRLDLARQLQEHPYRSLAIAAGFGYVLGGGLFTPLTRQLLGLGLRVAVLPAVQAQLLEGAAPEGGHPEEGLFGV